MTTQISDQPFEKVVCKYNTIFLRVSQDFKKGGIYMEEMIVKNVDVMRDLKKRQKTRMEISGWVFVGYVMLWK